MKHDITRAVIFFLSKILFFFVLFCFPLSFPCRVFAVWRRANVLRLPSAHWSSHQGHSNRRTAADVNSFRYVDKKNDFYRVKGESKIKKMTTGEWWNGLNWFDFLPWHSHSCTLYSAPRRVCSWRTSQRRATATRIRASGSDRRRGTVLRRRRSSPSNRPRWVNYRFNFHSTLFHYGTRFFYISLLNNGYV